MSNIITTMKEIVYKTVENMPSADFITGTVVKTNPLNIKINDKITLQPVHLYVLRGAIGKYPVSTSNGNGVALHSLKVGDMVALGKCQGGESYIVLGEVTKL